MKLLDLAGCVDYDLTPVSKAHLPSLENLYLSGTNPSPELLHLQSKKLPQLKVLRLANIETDIRVVCSRGDWQALRVFQAKGSSTILRNLHEASNRWGELRELVLHSSDVSMLPHGRAYWDNLEKLTLVSCPLFVGLRSTIKWLKLESLHINNCPNVAHLPEEIGQCKKLRTASFDGCTGLLDLPESIVKCEELKILSLIGCCNLVHLPKKLVDLQNLHYIDVRDCSFLVSMPTFVERRGYKKVFIRAEGTPSCNK